MGIYNQRQIIAKRNKNKSRSIGYIFCAISILLTILTIFIPLVSKYVYTAIGYVSYLIYFVLFLCGVSISSGKKYYINKTYLTIFVFFSISFISVLHILFCLPALKANNTFGEFGSYITTLIFHKSCGGVVFGAFTFLFIGILGVAGSLVIFSILSLIFGGLMIDYLSSAKDRSNLRKISAKRNNSLKSNSIPDEITVNFNPDDAYNLGKINKSMSFEEYNDYSNNKTEINDTEEYSSDEIDTFNSKYSSSTTVNNHFDNNNDFDFFSKDNLKSRLENNDINNEEYTQVTPEEESRQHARDLLFNNIRPQDEIEEDDDKNNKINTGEHELTFEEKLKKLREEPAKPVLPDVFKNNDYVRNFGSRSEEIASRESYRDTENELNTSQGNNFDFSNTFRTNQVSNNDVSIDQNDILSRSNNYTRRDDFSSRTDRLNRGYEYGPMAKNIDDNNNSDDFDRPMRIEQTRLSGPFMPEEKSKFNKATFVKRDTKYKAPPISLLKTQSDDPSKYGGDYKKNSEILERTLSTFKINAKVVNVVRGPSVTRYEMAMPVGIPVKKVLAYESDLQAALCAKNGVRLEAPIPGKNAFGVELPNDPRSTVGFKEIAESPEFNSSSVNLPIAIGKNINGEVVVKSLSKMVHMLVAGSTGSGKSIFLHSVIVSLMYKESPERLKFIMVDPKRVEFPIYNGMPHMMIPNAITDPDKAVNAFSWVVKEMERRYKVLEQFKVRDLQDYNNLDVVKNGDEKLMPYIVMIVDELAELMSVAKKEIEEKIRRITQLGRACGIHLVIATQRPSTEIITGTIKANMPTRVALTLANRFDSETILGEPGAEKLLGHGDMLFAPQDSLVPTRLQGAYITTSEINDIIKYVKENNPIGDFNDEMEQFISKTKESGTNGDSADGENGRVEDELFKDALKYVIERKKASTSMLQTRFYIGFNRATRLIAQMENMNYIGPSTGAKPREVYITMEDFYSIYGPDA